MNELGNRLKSLRKTTGVTQTEIEHSTGIKREYLSKMECGELTNPTLKTLRKLAKFYNMPISALINETPTGPSEILQERLYKVTQEKANLYSTIGALIEILRPYEIEYKKQEAADGTQN